MIALIETFWPFSVRRLANKPWRRQGQMKSAPGSEPSEPSEEFQRAAVWQTYPVFQLAFHAAFRLAFYQF